MCGAGTATVNGSAIYFRYGLPSAMAMAAGTAAGTAIMQLGGGHTAFETAVAETPHLHEIKSPPQELYEAVPITFAVTLAVAAPVMHRVRESFTFWRDGD